MDKHTESDMKTIAEAAVENRADHQFSAFEIAFNDAIDAAVSFIDKTFVAHLIGKGGEASDY